MRIFSAGVRIAVLVLALGATPVLAQQDSSSGMPQEQPGVPGQEPQGTVPDELLGMVGDFILEQEDESLPKCPITLTDQQALGGWAIQLPEPCAAPYPAADELVAWNIDDNDGSLYFLDAERKVVMRLFEDEDGLYDTDPNVTPRFYLMAPYDEDGTGGESDGAD